MIAQGQMQRLAAKQPPESKQRMDLGFNRIHDVGKSFLSI
jgi:hypothetical protein